MISDDVHYRFVSEQCRYHSEKAGDAFTLFVKIFSAVVGGALWLQVQPHVNPAMSRQLGRAAAGLVLAVASLCSIRIAENMRAWKGYRKAQCRIAGNDSDGRPIIDPPNVLRASVEEGALIVSMFAASIGFALLDPTGP
ncbi:MAG TPA: hypothetical protein VGF77_13365 [Allosphingosinicella sp.]|jgi:hypothetical protein